ncbi:MAG: hypothetical protein OJI67_07870, partial [Prosthecobacter sp.]|nr:hypothetical protein [Prosthecobacter sp.]
MKKHLHYLTLALAWVTLPLPAQSTGIALDQFNGNQFTEVRLATQAPSLIGFNASGIISTLSLPSGLSLVAGNLVLAPDWSQLTGVPSTFAPSAHGHIIADVTGLQSALDGKLASSSVSAFGLTLLDDATATDARDTLGLGTLAVANSLAFADLTSKPTSLTGYGITDPIVLTSSSYADPTWITSLAWGKLTGVPSTFAPSAHGHIIADVTGLQSA